MLCQVKKFLGKFRRDESGVALVEFGIFLPLFLLSFFVIVEFSRIFFSYQGAVVGVRDATRYLARVSDSDICVGRGDGTGDVIIGGAALARTIITRNMWNESAILPNNVQIGTVSAIFRCVVQPGDFRQLEIPIASVVATITIQLPLGGILEFNGQQLIPNITTDIADESRVFGV